MTRQHHTVAREWGHMRTTSTQPIVCGHSAASFVKMTGLTAVHRATEIMLKYRQRAGRRGHQNHQSQTKLQPKALPTCDRIQDQNQNQALDHESGQD